jgi:hypothetical protein
MTFAVRQREFWAAMLVLALSIGFLIWAKTYPATPGAVPVLVAWVTIVLSLIDITAQVETPFGHWVRRLITADKIVEWKMEGDEDASATRIALSLAWLSGYLAGLFLVGFIIATPIYVFGYMVIHGSRSVRDSALASAAVTLTIWLVFVKAFRYPLYNGLLFDGF